MCASVSASVKKKEMNYMYITDWQYYEKASDMESLITGGLGKRVSTYRIMLGFLRSPRPSPGGDTSSVVT